MKHIKHLALGLSAAAVICLGAIPSASAQYWDEDEDLDLLSSTITSATTTTGVGVVIGLIWLFSPIQASKNLDQYIAANTLEVQQGLTMGAGASTKDLAHFFGVSPRNHATFAHLLRRERKILQKAVSGKRDTAAFISHVKTAMLEHAQLRQDVARYTHI